MCQCFLKHENQPSILFPFNLSFGSILKQFWWGVASRWKKQYINSDQQSLSGGCMPKGIPLTEEDQNTRKHEIFNASMSLFLEQGFHETTMQEIARAAGMGKSTLYDYFKTKDDILISFVEDAIFDLTESAKQIAGQDIPPAERLHQVLLAHLKYLMANKEFYNKMTFEVQRLALQSQQRIQIKRHDYQDLICGLIEEAVRGGAFRPVNSLLAARTILYLLTPAVFTSRPTGTPERMMDEALDIFYHGVIKQT
jgi:AcrR family transcriptional regulator